MVTATSSTWHSSAWCRAANPAFATYECMTSQCMYHGPPDVLNQYSARAQHPSFDSQCAFLTVSSLPWYRSQYPMVDGKTSIGRQMQVTLFQLGTPSMPNTLYFDIWNQACSHGHDIVTIRVDLPNVRSWYGTRATHVWRCLSAVVHGSGVHLRYTKALQQPASLHPGPSLHRNLLLPKDTLA